MQVTQTPTQLRVAAVRSEHVPALLISLAILITAVYAVCELSRAANASYGVSEGIIPLVLIVYLLLPVAVRQLQPSRFSPLFRLMAFPAMIVVQAVFMIYRQSSIVMNGDDYVFDLESRTVEHNEEIEEHVDAIEAIELYRNTFPTIGDTFSIKLLLDSGDRIDVGNAVRSAREGVRIGEKIATFLNVPLVDRGDGLDPPETLGRPDGEFNGDDQWDEDAEDDDGEGAEPH